MISNNTPPAGRFPMRFLAAAVVLTAIVLAWLSWAASQSYEIARAARHRNFKIAELRGTVLYLDEVLTR